MADALRVTGDRDVRRMFERLERKDQRSIVRKATRAGAKIIQTAAKALVPRRTKRLLRGLKVRALKRSRVRQGHQVVITRKSAGVSGDAKGFYPAHQELGLRKKRRMRAHAFLRRAADQSADRVVRMMTDTVFDGIQAVARKP